MARVIGVMGESGSGKTTAMRNLPPKETFYLDCDKKGMNWKEWKKQYLPLDDKNNTDKGFYLKTDSFTNASTALQKINESERFKRIKYVVIDTLNGLMVAEEMRILAMQSGDKRSAWSDLAQNGWSIINQALMLRDDLTVIILCHSETVSDENGIIRTRIKTN
jgi:RecA/RadA recombinase